MSYTTVAQQVFEDVINTNSLVLLCGSLVSILLGFSFLLLLYFSRPARLLGSCSVRRHRTGRRVCVSQGGRVLIWDISNLPSTIQSEAEIVSANTDAGQNLDVDEWAAVSDPEVSCTENCLVLTLVGCAA